MGRVRGGERMPSWIVNTSGTPKGVTIDKVAARAYRMMDEPIGDYDLQECEPLFREIYFMIAVLAKESERQAEQIKQLLPDLT